MFARTRLVMSKVTEVTPSLVDSDEGKALAGEEGRDLFHLLRIGARTVKIGSTRAVDGPRVIAIQR